MKQVVPIWLPLTVVMLFSSQSYAANVGVGGGVSTLGLGLEMSYPVARKLNTRIGFNTFTFNAEGEEEDVEYEIDLKLNTLSAKLDWHPWAGTFRLTGGLHINNSTIDLVSSNQGEYDIGDDTYTGTVTVDGNLSFPKVAPYLGIGWGSSPAKARGWSFTAELGVLLQGSPILDLDASGTGQRQGDNFTIDVSNDAVFQQNLAKEENELQSDIDSFNIFPVIALGFMYQF